MDPDIEFSKQEARDLPTNSVHSKKDRFELLILSEAGKPIYSYTKREDAVTLMPLCSALIDYAHKTKKETLKSIKTSDGLVIHFNTRSPLIIIVIHDKNSYIDPCLLVEQVEAQVISILTAKTLNSVFEERPTFDLKRLIYGSEKLIDATANLCISPRKFGWPWAAAFIAVPSSNTNQHGAGPSSYHTTAPNLTLPHKPHRVLIPIVIIPPNIRDSIHNIIHSVITSSSKNMVFTLLFRIVSRKEKNEEDSENPSDSSSHGSNSQTSSGDSRLDQDDVIGFELMTVCNHHDRHKIKIADIHIVLALLSGSRAQLASVESLWMPICLPKFNQDAFLHSYIAYLNDNKHCIVMMCIDRDEFSSCQKSRNAIEEKLDVILKDPNQKSKINYQLSPLKHHHNLIRKLQFLWYQTSKQVFWWQRADQKSLHPVIYYVTKKMLQSSLKHLWLKVSEDIVFLGWHAPSFHLYAQFDSTVTAHEATELIQQITTWIKKEEDNFSIKDYR